MTQPSTASLLTVDEARELAALHPEDRFELHRGEVVKLTQPKLNHRSLQRHISRLLDPLTADYGLIYVEFGFRALPEYESRRTNVALISYARLAEAEALDEFFGAPDLAIEILSPSNRPGEMREKRALCFQSGCLSFWTLNPLRFTLSVEHDMSDEEIFGIGDAVSLQPFASATVIVADLFRRDRPVLRN